jgi:hypothetical protein
VVLGVNASSVVADRYYENVLNYPISIHYDAGTKLIYTDGGQIVQPSNGSVVGNFGASGLAVPDSTLNRVFILGQASTKIGTTSYTIESFDQTNFTAVDSITIDNVVGTPTALIRWGNNGIAFTTQVGYAPAPYYTGSGQLYVISGDFVKPSSTSAAKHVNSTTLVPVRRTWDTDNRLLHGAREKVVHRRDRPE